LGEERATAAEGTALWPLDAPSSSEKKKERKKKEVRKH
jgi:hypothetical protein